MRVRYDATTTAAAFLNWTRYFIELSSYFRSLKLSVCVYVNYTVAILSIQCANIKVSLFFHTLALFGIACLCYHNPSRSIYLKNTKVPIFQQVLIKLWNQKKRRTVEPFRTFCYILLLFDSLKSHTHQSRYYLFRVVFLKMVCMFRSVSFKKFSH